MSKTEEKDLIKQLKVEGKSLRNLYVKAICIVSEGPNDPDVIGEKVYIWDEILNKFDIWTMKVHPMIEQYLPYRLKEFSHGVVVGKKRALYDSVTFDEGKFFLFLKDIQNMLDAIDEIIPDKRLNWDLMLSPLYWIKQLISFLRFLTNKHKKSFIITSTIIMVLAAILTIVMFFKS